MTPQRYEPSIVTRRPNASPAPDRAAYHHGHLREALLDSAMALYAERGRLEFTLRELARAAGVTHAAPYRHFASKADVVTALSERALEQLAAAEHEALGRAGDDLEARVRALGEAYVGFALAEPLAFQLLFSTSAPSSSAGAAPRAESYRLLERTLSEAREAGVVRSDLSARELALAAWALVHGLASLLASGSLPPGKARRATKLLSVVFFEGVRPRPGSL
jgi:AcrR family transcriptional regulator